MTQRALKKFLKRNDCWNDFTQRMLKERNFEEIAEYVWGWKVIIYSLKDSE